MWVVIELDESKRLLLAWGPFAVKEVAEEWAREASSDSNLYTAVSLREPFVHGGMQ